jgi:hypothetical protein
LKNTPTTTQDDDYWKEISALCVDTESLRLQVQLLDIAKKTLEATSIHHPAKIHGALDLVHTLASRVDMLKM